MNKIILCLFFLFASLNPAKAEVRIPLTSGDDWVLDWGGSVRGGSSVLTEPVDGD